MFNAQRVKYLSTPLYRQRVHDKSISNRRRTGKANVDYQRHYMKIVEMLERLNLRYAGSIAIRPAFHWQITREALVFATAFAVSRIRSPRIRLPKSFISAASTERCSPTRAA